MRKNFKNCCFKTIKQTIVCKKCGKILKIVEKAQSGRVKNVLEKGVCEECKEKSRQESSIRMHLYNPMYNLETRNKVSKESSIRMHLYNPMYNLETRNKVSNTIKQNILEGKIIYKKGSEHYLWKGNRTFNKAVRIELRNWVKSKFEESNYTCQKCGKTHTELQVHHLEPLRDIIQNFLDKHDYTIDYINSIQGNEEYFSLIKEIVEYHEKNMQIGLVVCPNCHYEIDEYYKRKTYEDKENNKN